MRTLVLRAVAVTTVVALFGSVNLAYAASPDAKLDDARDRLEKVRAELEQVSASCERDEQRVERINADVEDAWSAVTEAEVAVTRQSRIVDETERRLRDFEAQAEDLEQESTDLIARLYKRGLVDPTLHSLLMSSSTEQALSRAQVLNTVTKDDRAALEDLLSTQAAVDGERVVFEEQSERLEQALTERQATVDELEGLQVTYEEKVASCNEQVAELQQEKAVAEEDERELAAAIQDAGVTVDDVPEPVSAGGWTWPARGTLTSGFGHRWGRLHAGIDVAASTGTPIYAAKGGVVSYAGVMGGYGNIVVINHGGGMTTRYAHQSAIGASVGQTVEAGQTIGAVGNTGNSTGPHLHFEIRINDQPQNPLGYLP